MKPMLRIIGCLSIVLFLITGTMVGKSLEGTRNKERIKSAGWIGIMVRDVSEKMARKANLASEEGAFVVKVFENSPADSAGIQEGDVIIEFNEKKLFDSNDLAKIVCRTLPETKVSIMFIRNGEKKTVHVLVGKKKEPRQWTFGEILPMPDLHVFTGYHILGLHLLTLNEQLGEYFGAPQNEGVLIEEVERKSAAEKAGLKAGDIIIRVGNKTIDVVEKIRKELQKYDEGDMVEFEILRKSTKKTVKVEIVEPQSLQKNFFFRNPHFRMFRSDLFDNAEMPLEMDEPQTESETLQKEFHGPCENIRCWEQKTQCQRL
jgi:predicted metalloprotease with PDZ domain